MANEINKVSTPLLQHGNQNHTIKSATINTGKSQTAHDSNLVTNADKVTVTDSAAKLQALEQHIANMPVVDEQRVASIRAAIQNGSYQMDPERTATKLLGLETALHRP
ncbi:MAG: flagellar biosynthesis anti-sigma factor FlgM [Gammaproteobacteria bacterium]|nr:flagellar biosynthesis anti-sigma factor FlgM [Gammaproteobacteria bacterium]